MDQSSERKRMEEHYAEMADGELEDVASEGYELTPIALEALIAELQKRGLSIELLNSTPATAEPATPVLATKSEPRSAEEANEGEVEFQSLVILKRYRDLPEAVMAKGILDSSGVKCYLVDDNMVRMDWFISNGIGGAKLMVRPEDVEQANEILGQPVPEVFDYGSNEPFKQPKCPRCGSVNITFEALNKPASYATMVVRVPIPIPSPKWICEDCGARWVEEEDELTKEEPQP